MIASFRRRVALSLLFAFLAGLGSWDLQARALAHQVEHAIAMAHPAAAADHGHGHGHDHDHDTPRSDPPSPDGDHAVLHAVAAASAATLAAAWQPDAERGGIVAAPFVPSRVVPAALDPPLRPPRASPTPA
jgi:hypothetical protein